MTSLSDQSGWSRRIPAFLSSRAKTLISRQTRSRCAPLIERRISSCIAWISGDVSLTAISRCYHRTLYNSCVSSDFSLRKMAEADFPTRWGHFRIWALKASSDTILRGPVQQPATAARKKPSRWSLAIFMQHRRWCEFTRSALQVTSSVPCAATVANNLRWRSQ